MARLVIGSFIAIWIGLKLDSLLNISPMMLILFLVYVVIGSLYLLVKELSCGK